MGRRKSLPFTSQQQPPSSDDEDNRPTPLPSSQPTRKPSSTLPPSKQHQPSSSSESETESSSEEEEEEVEEPQQQKKATQDSSSSEEVEESSEEEEESESPPPPPPKKPSSSSVASPPSAKTKPKPQPQPKPKPKPPPSFSSTSDHEQPPAKIPSAKESLEKPKKTTAERKRKTTETPTKEDVGNGPSAKKVFERLWNDEDVLVLLHGLEEFHSTHGHDPANTADAAALLDMLDSRLQGVFAPSQLISKIRHSRRKYANNLARERECASSLIFSSFHDKQVYELSKKVWGNAAVAERASRSSRAARVKAAKSFTAGPAVATPAEAERDEQFSVLERAMGLVLGEVWKHGAKSETLSRGLRMMRPEVIADFCDKLKELDLEEVRLWSRRLQLMSHVLKSSEEVLANEAGV